MIAVTGDADPCFLSASACQVGFAGGAGATQLSGQLCVCVRVIDRDGQKDRNKRLPPTKNTTVMTSVSTVIDMLWTVGRTLSPCCLLDIQMTFDPRKRRLIGAGC